jgi:hypothetical protein
MQPVTMHVRLNQAWKQSVAFAIDNRGTRWVLRMASTGRDRRDLAAFGVKDDSCVRMCGMAVE